MDGLGGGVDIETQLRLLTLLENPAVVVAAAAANDTNALREFLVKHPSEVMGGERERERNLLLLLYKTKKGKQRDRVTYYNKEIKGIP